MVSPPFCGILEFQRASDRNRYYQCKKIIFNDLQGVSNDMKLNWYSYQMEDVSYYDCKDNFGFQLSTPAGDGTLGGAADDSMLVDAVEMPGSDPERERHFPSVNECCNNQEF